MSKVVSLDDFKAAKANGGWRVSKLRCGTCGNLAVAVGPCGSNNPPCTRCGGATVRELEAQTRDDGSPDPHLEQRRFLVGALEDLLAAVTAGHVDAMFLVIHQAEAHPEGPGCASCFSGNLDFVHQLGALELAKADLIHRANDPND